MPTLLFISSVDGSTDKSNCCTNNSCVDERSIWIVWATAIVGYLFYYAVNEFTGKHHRDYRTPQKNQKGAPKHKQRVEASKSSSSCDTSSQFHGVDGDSDDSAHHDDGFDQSEEHSERNKRQTCGDGKREQVPRQSISATIQKISKAKPEQPEGTLAMVSWYSYIIFGTGFDMLLSFKIFLGRFDYRQMQLALLKETRSNTAQSYNKLSVFDFSHCSQSDHGGFWFDFVSDCGDGFNSSYQISRMLAQPSLDVVTQNGKRTLPRGKVMVNGGDLAYPDPTANNYEKRFFRTFEDALPPPPSFRRQHISIQKPALPVKCWDVGVKTKARNQKSKDADLSRYQGPCAFLST